jgi:hypothetical protein
MSYKLFEVMDLYNIIMRWHAGYKIRQISKTLQIDRKTVRLRVESPFGLTPSGGSQGQGMAWAFPTNS